MDETLGRALLTLARTTIRAHLAGESSPGLPDVEGADGPCSGGFVTLRKKGRLRGCMGRFKPAGNLAETIQQVALTVLEDPRFVSTPVTLDELGEIALEISALSPMVRTDDPLSLELGVHGIYIRKGSRSGCFLPQVATEQGWDIERFLSRCCEGKAGLPADAWKEPEAEVYLFTADVVTETK